MSSRSPLRCIWALIRPTGPVVIPTRLHIYSGPPVSTTHTRAATCGATSKQHRQHRDRAGRELALASGRASLPALAVASCHHRNEALRVQQHHPARELRSECGPAAPATQAQEGAVTASSGFEGEAKASTCTEVAAVMRMIIAIDASYTWTSQQHHRQVVSSRRSPASTCWVPLVRRRTARALSKALIPAASATAWVRESRWRSLAVER